MPRLILLPATGLKDDASVFATALAAARQFDSHLIALHVRPDIRREIASMAAVDMGVSAGLDSMIANLEKEADDRERSASQAWTAFRGANAIPFADGPGTPGVTGEWRADIGNVADCLADHGRAADLTVAGRAREGGIVAMDILEAALMESGRPLLIAPDTPPGPFGGPVAIAWKNTRESAKAIAAGLPFIRKASAVTLVTVQESDADAATDHSPGRMAAALRWHNPKVAVKALRRGPRGAVETLLGAVAEVKASLLIMGGYGHTRLREAVFGGFTRAVLEAAPVPVLMAH
jgi:nucleotide-binding universal stress UspA family protein